jgi:hypothetical protein
MLPERCSRETDRITALTALSQRLRSTLFTLSRPIWAADFPAFFWTLLEDAQSSVLPDLGYFPPHPSELGLSRCLFRRASPFRARLDSALDSFPDSPAPGNLILSECYNFVPERPFLTEQDRALAILVLFRCLFNRAYERFPWRFVPRIPRADLAVIAGQPLDSFAFPREMVGNQEAALSVGEFFGRDRMLREAGLQLAGAAWEPNPMDALFAVHQAVAIVNTAACANSKRSEVLAFDDRFALLHGAVLGAANADPDVFWVAWMVGQFTPADALSMPMEYAKATIEAVAAACLGR